MKKLKTIIIFIFFVSISATGKSQVIKPYSPAFTLYYVGNSVYIQYRLSKNNSREKVNIILYRGNEKNEGLKAIHQLNNLSVSTDYLHIDSTLPARGIYQYTVEVVSNGATILRESATVYAYPITVAPFIKSFDANTKKGTNEVSLSWNVANVFLVRNIILLRSRKRDDIFKPIVTLKKEENSFLDKVDETNETFFYKLQIANAATGELIYTPAIQVITEFIIKPMRPLNVRGILKNDKPQIFWQSADTLSRGFYVFKKLSTDEKFFQASNIIFRDPKNQMSWTDSGSQIKPGTTYQYKVIAESNSNTKSASSDTIIISTGNDKILLSPPYDLRLLQNGDSIDIIWTPDEEKSDYISEYVISQKKVSERNFTIIGTASAFAMRNYITVATPESGSSFMVKSKSGSKESVPTEPVTWIDKTEKTFGPRFIKAEIIDNVLNISWLNMEDENIREYRLYKWQGRDFKMIENIDKNSNTILVKNYIASEKNQYMLTAVNTKGVENKGTKPITVY